MCYVVDKIWVLNPIKFVSIRRNEIKSKMNIGSVRGDALAGQPIYINRADDIQQRASMMLQDVHYVFEVHFEMTPVAADGDNPGKFQEMIRRRLQKGQNFAQPYFGTRECTANVRLWEAGGPIPSIR